MNTLIFRTVAPFITALMLLFSVFVLLRGHNEPGGGFIGGLIAASALAIYGIAFGVGAVRRALRFHPLAVAGCGLLLATLSGLLSIVFGVPFMTGLWAYPVIFDVEVPVATVMSFDVGVYLVVVGAITSIALALEQEPGPDVPIDEAAAAAAPAGTDAGKTGKGASGKPTGKTARKPEKGD